MGWRDIISSPDPSRALYLAMRKNQTASGAADTFQRGFEGVVGGGMEALGRFGNALATPARAIAAAATNAAGTRARPIDVSDYALHGRDLETGDRAEQYGDLLAGTLEDAGEVKPGSFASKVLRMAGNTITDPVAAPGLLAGAEAVGALAGGLTPSVSSVELAPRRGAPRGRLDPNFSPPRGPGGLPRLPGEPVPLTSSPPPGPGQPGGPVRPPGVTDIPRGPGPGPTVTQEVPMHLRGTGEGPVGMRTEAVRSPFMGSGNRPTAGSARKMARRRGPGYDPAEEYVNSGQAARDAAGRRQGG